MLVAGVGRSRKEAARCSMRVAGVGRSRRDVSSLVVNQLVSS